MSTYQRCLSKSLIFFSVFFIIFLLFIESNIGFKWIFNFTSRFFIGLKSEEISGNWRDFTLKNIKYNIFGISIKANSIHVILDIKSLFKKYTIFTEVETKNLIISLKKNTFINPLIKTTSNNLLKTQVFMNYPMIFKKIHADKVLFKTPRVNIFCFNVLSGIKLRNNKIIFFPTCVNTIHVISPNINVKKKYIIDKSSLIKNVHHSQEICSFLSFFSHNSKIFFPLDIDLMNLKCTKISFLDYKNDNLFKVELKSKLEKNVLNITKIKIDSSVLKIQSYGKLIFNNDYSVSCTINSTILMPRLQNKKIKCLFQAYLNEKLKFKLSSNDLYKTSVHGIVILDKLNYPFFINLHIKNLLLSVKKDFILQIDSIDGILKGQINNYTLSLKNIFTIKGMPTIFMNINGKGNLRNIFLKRIKLFPVKKTTSYKKIVYLERNIHNNQYILELIGKINSAGKADDNKYTLCFPKINLNGNIMKKKLSILGSIYYKKFNLLETPGINLLAGKNKLYLKGSLGKKCSIYSSIYANHLDYFLPDLKGIIKAKMNFHGDCMFPSINSEITANNLNWNNTSLKNIKIFAKIKNQRSGNFLIKTKKIHLLNFYIDSLNMKLHWNNHKQHFYFLLKSHMLTINVIINGMINPETGNWYGIAKKIHIKTIWGQIITKKNPSIYYYTSNNKMNDFYKKNINIKNIIYSFLKKTKKSLFNIFHESSINFKSQSSINIKLRSMSETKISDGRIILIVNNIKLKKKKEEKFFYEKLDYLKLSIDLIKNNFKSTWMGRKITNSLEEKKEEKKIYGYLNIIDIYNKQDMEGQFTISHFPMSFINFFTTNFREAHGTFNSNIKIFGTVYQPKASADFDFQNIFVKSDDILKYIILFFPYFPSKTENIKINEEIIMKKGNVLFTLDSFIKNSNNIMEWNLLFKSKKVALVIFPKIKLKFSSKLNLHYFLSKYDLIGYINFPWFHFKIDEKNFIF